MLHIAFLLLAANVFAEEIVNANMLYEAASEAYTAKNYQAAAEGYEQVAAIGQVSPALYYNLGNAYFRLGSMGKAILNYERAIKLDPEYVDAAFNLRLANLRIADRVDPVEEFVLAKWYKATVHGRSASGWGMGAMAAVWLALVFGVVYIFASSLWLRRIGFGLMVALLISSVVLILFARNQHQFENTVTHAIIIVTNTYVKAAPDLSSTDLFILREGTKVTLMGSEDGWQKVKVGDTAGDKVGWVRQDVLGMI